MDGDGPLVTSIATTPIEYVGFSVPTDVAFLHRMPVSVGLAPR
ncbi:MAG TPA: hypothetical protein VEL73_01655 [Mycobacteriales bacterium]|nr:hypothetical protein [Mycobacteriales bacterium]